MILIRRQQGVAALLTTIFVAVFLSILTISLADVLNTEQQQTLDLHNSDRAEEAAQAGVEDALARIKYWATKGCTYTETNGAPAGVNGCATGGQDFSSNTCVGSGGSDSIWEFTEAAGTACWTHRNIASNGNTTTGRLVADTGDPTQASTAQINLNDQNGGATRALIINWGTNNNTYCSLNTPWPPNTDGALELTLISYDNNGNVANPVKGVFVPKVTSGVPCNVNAPGTSQYNDLINPGGTAPIACPAKYNLTTAGNGSQYKFCTEIQLPPNQTANYKNAYLRLRARFAGVNFSVVALTALCPTASANCSLSSLPTNSLTIDVTGQSGTLYRRVIAQSSVTNPQIYSIFDFVLFSENDLNKNYACVNADAGTDCR